MGLTQAQLAERLGVTASSVARWEQGILGIRESAARLLQLVVQAESKTKRKRGKR
jgi:transcriptional regulator with XRE-family HTH domain